jgi:predicted nucleotide-binding protein
MAKQKTPTAPRESTRLLISRNEATKQLDERVQCGQELLKRQIRAERDFDACNADFESWDEYNVEMLSRMFSAPVYGEEYASWSVLSTLVNPSLVEKSAELANEIKDKCRKLISTRDRLAIIPEPVPTARTTAVQAGSRSSRKVFIVHGHDEALKLDVARFVERLGLNAVILAEQANQGRTIIEKFEAHAEDAGFAIVLLTPDDVGAPAGNSPALKSRARQNVILELGYFIGRLTRSRVCALHKGNVELPSDILGVVYVSVAANWKLQLAGEMKTAWPDLDLNKAY